MAETTTTSLGERVVRASHDGVELWALPLGVPQVVSFRASFLTGLDLAGVDRMRQRAVARLLDRGSERLDRFEIAEWLEGRGADLHFYSDGLRFGFSGRALRGDVTDVLVLAAELLATPRLDPAEIEKVKREIDAGLRQAATDTAYLSDAALNRILYAPDHPSFSMPLDAQRGFLDALTRGDLVAFHAEHLLRKSLLMSAAGDLDGLPLEDLIAPFAGESRGDTTPAVSPAKSAVPGQTDVPVSDKTNFDVRMGQGLRLRRRDADFQPLRVGVFALGGNFSARLMQEVRDRRGLTYGIRASLEDVDVDHDGHFGVRATFSPADLARGLEATSEVVAEWADGGVSEEEVERVKETILGTYDVGLSTTRGLASTLLHRAEQGFAPDYLDGYRAEVRAVSAGAVNAAIQAYIKPDELHIVTSGPPRSGVESGKG